MPAKRPRNKNSQTFNGLERGRSSGASLIACPNCAELVQAKAVACRFCNHGLAEGLYKRCPFCSESIRSTAARCRVCRSPLPVEDDLPQTIDFPNTRPDKKGKSDLKSVSFIDSIPGDDDADGLVILIDGSLRRYIKCEGINALLLDDNEREGLARAFSTFANTCQSDVQIIVRSRSLPVDQFLSSSRSAVKTDNDYLNWYADYTDKWFRRVQDVHFITQREFFVVVTYQPPDRHKGKSENSPSVNSSPSRSQKQDLLALSRLTRIACEQLRVSSLRPTVLNRKQVRNLIYSELNPALAQRDADTPPSVDGKPEAAVLTASALKVSEEYIWLDGRYICTQSLKHVPHLTWMGWLVDLLTISVEFTMSIFIHPTKSGESDESGDSSESGSPTTNEVVLEKSERDSEKLVSTAPYAKPSQAIRNSEKTFDVSLYISTISNTAERLVHQSDEIRRVFNNRGAILDRAQLTQLSAWQSTLPIAVNKLGVVHRVMSPTVGTFWPFFTAACGTPDGTPFGFALASRQPVLLNPFFRGAGKEANNMLVVGSTGAGKSFAMSMLFLRLLPGGTRFVVVDKTVDNSGGYRFLTELLGPELTSYVELGQTSGMILNPFDLAAADKPGKPSAEKITSLLSLFDLMIAPEGQYELTLQEKSLLDGLIRTAYAEAHARETVPTMSELFELTARAATDEVDQPKRDQLSTLARNLSFFTTQGIFAGLLDGKTSFDVEKPFLVFDTKELNEPRLERIAQFITTEFIRRRAADYKSRNVKFATVIDQADIWMRTKTGVQLLDGLSRQSRQYGMMFVCIAQQLKDFIKQSETADSVVKNSHVKLILRQDISDLSLLKETLGLSEAEVSSVENFSKDVEKRRDSHCLLMVGSVHGTIRLVPSPMDYWICTSEPMHDIPKRAEMREEVKRDNPKLNDTDAARRTVYYLGLSNEN
jgi:type IV secretory pathway VirB4 component